MFLLVTGTDPLSDSDEELLVLDVDFGEILWTRAVTYTFSSRSVWGNTVCLGGVNPEDTYLYALDVATGRVRWNFDAGQPVSTPPAADEEHVYFGADHDLYALDRATGRQIWRIQTPDYLVSEPLPVRKRAVLVWQQDDTVSAYDACTGKTLWRFSADASWGELFLTDKTVYALSSKSLHALDVYTGRSKWNLTREDDRWLPTLRDDDKQEIYFGLKDNTYLLFDEETGSVEKRSELPYKGLGRIVGNRIYLSDRSRCHILDKRTGRSLWKYSADSVISHRPAVRDGRLYLASLNGVAYALTEPRNIRRKRYVDLAKQLMNRAAASRENGKAQEAIALYERIIREVEPGHPDAWLHLALTLEQVGQEVKALETWYRGLGFLADDERKADIAREHICRLDGSLWTWIGQYRLEYQRILHLEGKRLYVWNLKDRQICAVDITDGQIDRAYDVGGGYVSRNAVRFTRELILASSYNTGVRAIERDSGRVRWEYKAGGGVSNATVANGAAYVTCWTSETDRDKGAIAKIDLVSGKVLWERRIDSVGCPATVVNDTVYIGTAAKDGGIWALNTEDGSIKWRTQSPPGRIGVKGTIIARDGVLYFNGDFFDKAAFALDMNSGEIRWKHH
ncbi:MAG: PQQ-binding-like beta-propeller repeat protein [Pirellulales bacterium]